MKRRAAIMNIGVLLTSGQPDLMARQLLFNESTPKAWISVYDFGAIADTDISDAVQKGVDFLSSVGGGTLDFSGIVGECKDISISGVSNLSLKGSGARIRRPAESGSKTLIFNVQNGSENINIFGFARLDGGFSSSKKSTGSNPIILIGNQLGNRYPNKNISIFDNNISGSNWAGIVVYGRSKNQLPVACINRNIRIFNNNISDCAGNGIFIYKNATDIEVYNNRIDGVGQDGIAFDTMAASDSMTTEAIYDVRVYDNEIKNFGKTAQGVGILFKGAVSHFFATGNNISEGLRQSKVANNYAIMMNVDASLSGAPSNGRIEENEISNINATISGVGILVGQGCSEIIVKSNTISYTSGPAFYVLQDAVNVQVHENTASSCAHGDYGFRFEGRFNKEIKNLYVRRNVFHKGGGSAIGGFKFSRIIGGVASFNEASDFTCSAFNYDKCIDFITNTSINESECR